MSTNNPDINTTPSVNKHSDSPDKDVNEGSSSNRKRVPAVRRAAAILTLLAENDSAMNLSEIARGINILPSSCLQLLRELAKARLVTINKRFKTYSLGPKIIELASAASRQDIIVELVQPHLNDIATSYGVTTTASAPTEDNHVVLIAYAHPPVSVSLNVTLGGRVPLMSGAAGRCLAAFGNYSSNELKEAFTAVRWQVPLAFETWLTEVNSVKQHGYSEDKGVFTKGVTTIAVPVFFPGGSVRCILGAGAISAQLDAATKKKIITALKKAAQDINH